MFLFVLGSGIAHCQATRYVNWTYRAEPLSDHEALIIVTADVIPGWHIYSQHLQEGGPQPTRFLFDSSAHYVLTGAMDEKGKGFKYYDDVYEMEVMWYSGRVTFTKRIILKQPVTPVNGTVEYMTCNNSACLPDKRMFTINVDLTRQHP